MRCHASYWSAELTSTRIVWSVELTSARVVWSVELTSARVVWSVKLTSISHPTGYLGGWNSAKWLFFDLTISLYFNSETHYYYYRCSRTLEFRINGGLLNTNEGGGLGLGFCNLRKRPHVDSELESKLTDSHRYLFFAATSREIINVQL